jgi:hypothetical protein
MIAPADIQLWLTDPVLTICSDQQALVAGATGFQVEWHPKRFTSLIKKALATVLGFPVAIEYVAVADLSQNNQEHAPPTPPPPFEQIADGQTGKTVEHTV